MCIRDRVFHVGDDFDFDEIAAASVTGNARDAYGLLGVACAGGIGQQRDILGNEVENVVSGCVRVDPAQCDGDQLRAAGDQHFRDERVGGKLAGAGQ